MICVSHFNHPPNHCLVNVILVTGAVAVIVGMIVVVIVVMIVVMVMTVFGMGFVMTVFRMGLVVCLSWCCQQGNDRNCHE